MILKFTFIAFLHICLFSKMLLAQTDDNKKTGWLRLTAGNIFIIPVRDNHGFQSISAGVFSQKTDILFFGMEFTNGFNGFPGVNSFPLQFLFNMKLLGGANYRNEHFYLGASSGLCGIMANRRKSNTSYETEKILGIGLPVDAE